MVALYLNGEREFENITPFPLGDVVEPPPCLFDQSPTSFASMPPPPNAPLLPPAPTTQLPSCAFFNEPPPPPLLTHPLEPIASFFNHSHHPIAAFFDHPQEPIAVEQGEEGEIENFDLDLWGGGGGVLGVADLDARERDLARRERDLSRRERDLHLERLTDEQKKGMKNEKERLRRQERRQEKRKEKRSSPPRSYRNSDREKHAPGGPGRSGFAYKNKN
jgi:hypothetical protein